MSNIVAEINQEVQEMFQELTDTENVSIAAVEKQVSAAAGSWGQRLSEAILSETASSTDGSPVSVPCPSCQGHSPSASVPGSQLYNGLWGSACVEMGV